MVVVFVVEVRINQTRCINFFMAKLGYVVKSERRVSTVESGTCEIELGYWCRVWGERASGNVDFSDEISFREFSVKFGEFDSVLIRS